MKNNIFVKNLMLALLVLILARYSNADDLLPNCELTKKNTQYKQLNDYIVHNSVMAKNCQRLNDYEFVYTTDTNFYYCNFKMIDKNACNEDDTGAWHPSELVRQTQFNNDKGKQFVLYANARLSHGIYSSGFHVFFFSPKSENSRGYKIIHLKNAGDFNGGYSDDGEACSDLNSDDQAIELIGNGYEIINNGKNNAGVRFNQKITSCKTNTASTRTLEYKWYVNDFIETKNKTK